MSHDTPNPSVINNNNHGIYGSGDVARDQVDYDADRAEAAAERAVASADAALLSEQNAKISETNALVSEDAAKISEDNAKTSETNAALSETNAGTAETNAAASASAALVSETNAAQSAADAAAEVGVLTPRVEGLEAVSHELQIASTVPYTNTTSGLTATDVQAAIDEVVATPGGVNWGGNYKTTSFTAVAANGYHVSGVGITVTLPATPEDGDVVILTDAVGDWDTNNVSVVGGTIEGDTELILDYRGGEVQLVYSATSTQWEVSLAGAGPQAVVEERFPAGQATYTLVTTPPNETSIDVYVDQVFQDTTAYTLSGNLLQFGTAITGDLVVRHHGFQSFNDTTLSVSLFTGDGVKTDFDLGVTPSSANNILVTVDAVPQSTTAYGFTGTTLQFTEAPVNGAKIESRVIAQAGKNVVPEDNSVTTAKIVTGAVTEEKLSTTVNNRIADAWCLYDGVTLTEIRDSFNISGIVDNAIGDTTLTFATNLPNNNYSVATDTGGITAATSTTRTINVLDASSARSLSSIRIGTAYSNSATNRTPLDTDYNSVVVFCTP